jgi:hypothetical protein
VPRSKTLESDPNYSLQLSHDELYWLARAFNIHTLPLPGEFAGSLFSPEVQKELNQGQVSLVARNLIRRVNRQGWQVDPLPAALVRWLGASKWKFFAQVLRLDGETGQLHAFVEHEAGLSVAMDERNYSVVLYPNSTALQSGLQSWIDASLPDTSKIPNESPKPELASFLLPQPETLIPVAWRDKKLAGEILARVFPDARLKKATIKWLESLEWISTLTRVNLETENEKVESRIVICGRGVELWSGGGALPHPEILPLSPISQVAAKSLIGILL